MECLPRIYPATSTRRKTCLHGHTPRCPLHFSGFSVCCRRHKVNPVEMLLKYIVALKLQHNLLGAECLVREIPPPPSTAHVEYASSDIKPIFYILFQQAQRWIITFSAASYVRRLNVQYTRPLPSRVPLGLE